jgi:hypothetical protein
VPRKSEWIQNLADIQTQLGTFPVGTLLDRAAIETTFRVRPRQANRILHRMGASSVGGALVLPARDLLSRLKQMQKDEGVVFEQARRKRFGQRLEQLRREAEGRKIQIPPLPEDSPREVDALPQEIRLTPGELRVQFSHPVDLLQKLLLLTQTISADWTAFQSRVGGAGERW